MILVSYIGYYCYKENGLWYRFPKVLSQLTQYELDWKTEYRDGTCFLRPEQDYTAFNKCETPAAIGKK